MTTFAFFENIFNRALDLLSYSINLGGGISVSLLGVMIGVILIGFVVSVVRKLYD